MSRHVPAGSGAMSRHVLAGSGARGAIAVGTIGSLLILLGASQGASPYALKQPGAWFFGIPTGHHIAFPGPRPQGTLAFLAVLAVLGGMTLLGLAWVWLVRVRGQDGGLSWRLVALGVVLWTLPLVVVAPVFSRDVYTYAAQGQMMAAHLNPYHHGPSVLGRSNAYTRLTDPIWRRSVSPYGPLFLLLDEGIVLATGHSVLWTVELLRLACLAGVWLAAGGAAVIARRLDKDPVLTVVLVALNPLLLLHLVAGAHDDALMLGLLLVGLAAAVEGRAWLGVLCCSLGAAFKVPALLGCAYIGWSCLLPRAASLARRAVGAAVASAVGVAVLGVLGAVSGLGLGWIKGLSNAGVVRLWASPTTGVGMAFGRLLQDAGIIH
ncbi:MAG TPA: polyprenol phosphomannose-dependent alpha 1,6 mannosyltransferase MptB, partial [Acidimicrobiales bacterium]|nr:polyprenol phosphomannose-dependent alpha 1,6 mannosyltransferase MptB [Acidimicrobiales bacterium]